MPFPDEAFADRVVVSPYLDSWATEGESLVRSLSELLPDAVRVDHIGSTSVPGLPAKDCIDAMVQVDTLDGDIATRLEREGFRKRPEEWNRLETTYGVTVPKLVFAAPPGGRRVNVHVRLTGGGNVRYALLFGDFLRADAAARDAWGAFKTRLAATAVDIYDYGQIKASVQPLLMRAAEQWADESRWRIDV